MVLLGITSKMSWVVFTMLLWCCHGVARPYL